MCKKWEMEENVKKRGMRRRKKEKANEGAERFLREIG